MEEINIDNLCIDETFRKFMESIRDEVDRLLNENQTDSLPVTIDLQANELTANSEDIYAIWASIKVRSDYFSIGDFEFERMKGNKKHLHSLVKVRFIDFLWSIEALREIKFEVLRRFDPRHETPDDYLH